MTTKTNIPPFLVFDVESIGLHGEAFAVAGGVYVDGIRQTEFCFSCPPEEARGDDNDRAWISVNVPSIQVTHSTPWDVCEAFWDEWVKAKERLPDLIMAGECIWPVEARFVAMCVSHDIKSRNWTGPYPLHDIASMMLAAGMDPIATYERLPDELPAHNPVGDARQSARLLMMALMRREKP